MTEKIAWEGGSVSGAWHKAKGERALVLTHGAGGNMDTPSLKAYAEAMAAKGVSVLRFNLPYAEAGRKSPGSPTVSESCWRSVLEHARERAGIVTIGGRSYGGRMASHIAAEGAGCAGLVFLAYPLHAPGKQDRLRDEHLKKINVPMLFLQGDRDTFATAALLEQVVATLPTATLHWLPGGDHSHKVRGRTPADVNDELVTATINWMAPAR